MNLHDISDALQNQPHKSNTLREFAILIPLIQREDGLHVLFEVRAATLKAQPSEVCFPGGKLEANETPLEGAIREATEEIQISSDQIEVLGPVPPLTTSFLYKLHPYVAVLKDYDPNAHPFNEAEVESLFTVPLDHFLCHKPEFHELKSQLIPSELFPYHKIQNGEAYNWKTASHEVLFYEYKEHIIWGLTAKMLYDFVQILQKQQDTKK